MRALSTTYDVALFTLKQNIFFKYGSRLVLIGNLLKNNTTAAHALIFDRYFDGDVGGGTNVYEEAGSSVLGKGSGGPYGEGLMLTSLTPSLVYAIGAETYANFSSRGAAHCDHLFEPNPTAPGDYAGIVSHFTTIAAGATVNFKVGYRLM